jgi:uncharacterized protein
MQNLREEGSAMTVLITIALILVIIGAINWGLVGFFNFNLVSAIFGDRSALSRIIYALVGLAGLYTIFVLTRVIPCAAGTRPGF